MCQHWLVRSHQKRGCTGWSSSVSKLYIYIYEYTQNRHWFMNKYYFPWHLLLCFRKESCIHVTVKPGLQLAIYYLYITSKYYVSLLLIYPWLFTIPLQFETSFKAGMKTKAYLKPVKSVICRMVSLKGLEIIDISHHCSFPTGCLLTHFSQQNILSSSTTCDNNIDILTIMKEYSIIINKNNSPVM